MTATKEAAATCLWDIGAELDDIHVQFHQVRNMLYVYDEHLEGELDFMKKCDAGYVQHFIKRYDVLRSVMEVMQLRINDAIDAMRVQIDAVYEADRKARPRPLDVFCGKIATERR